LIYLSAILLGLALGGMCLGIFISLRIFNFPDITTDGTYTLGAVIGAIGIMQEWPLVWTCFGVISAGAIGGIITGLLHTMLRLNALLSGILVMTGLYSVNLYILGKSNIPIPRSMPHLLNIISSFSNSLWNELLVVLTIMALLVFGIYYMLKTDFGLAMRAVGNNPKMAKSVGISIDYFKIIGLAIANSLTALSGFLIIQVQGFVDINMGIGIVIIGLGSVIIGESLSAALGIQSMIGRLVFVILGAIVFRLILSVSLMIGLDPIWLKGITALMVIFILFGTRFFPGNKIQYDSHN
jgi:putative ABC transport system permease protein